MQKQVSALEFLLLILTLGILSLKDKNKYFLK